VHELSIAVALVDLACEETTHLGTARIHALHVRIGPLSGVVEDALRFSFEVAAAGTTVDGATLAFERVPLVVYCATCDAEREIASPQHLRCPVCDTPTPQICQGTELQLAALEVVDDTPHR
jgi:hydrogenase nickel incorporation protein HypA/HybF